MEQVSHHFQLQPFGPETREKSLEISGSLTRLSGVLVIDYRVEGDLDTISWPAPSTTSDRCHDLWQNTCFEFFVNPKGASGYWEGNLSPSGCWNLYRFSAYREDMREEKAVDTLWSLNSQDNSVWNFVCRLETSGIFGDEIELKVGVSSVIRSRADAVSYWALCHPGLKPDFHDRASFNIELPAVAG